jgi:hypothetical protein
MRCKLSDICSHRKGKTEVKRLNNITYISTENMLPNKGGITEASSLPSIVLTQEYRKGDVLVSNIRPYFKKIWQAKYDGGCSNDVLVFTPNPMTDKDFLYYVLANDEFFLYSMATSKGTKMPRGDKDSIMQYEIPDIGLDRQRKIASVLKSLDGKIQLNIAINNNLEQQAQAIYSRMFIEHRQESWSTGQLSDLISVKYGKDHKKLADGNYPVYGSGGIIRYVEKPLHTGESVLIPRKGTLNNVIYVNEAFWSVDTMFYTEMLHPNIAKFVYHFVKSKDLASLNAGSAVPSMTTNILNAMQLYIPDEKTLKKFENIVSPMYSAMQENTKESKILANTRDTLLPKLMSGELDVSDIDL